MAKAQTFQDWKIQHELTDTTVTALKENGFDSVQSCELLNTAMIQKHFSKSLTLGQTLLLKAVESLSKVSSVGSDAMDHQGISTASVKDTDKDTMTSAATSSAVALASTLDASLQQRGIYAASLLNLISANQPVSDPTINMDNGNGLTLDPFSCNNSNSSKLYDIRDFVTTMPRERKEWASIKAGDMEFNLTDTKPKLDNIPQMQYMEASLCTLQEMAVKDGASLPQVLQYVGYLIQKVNMGQRFQWKSVLKYGSEYRKTQAEAGFTDGTDSSFMMQLFLQNMVRPSTSSNTQHRQTEFDRPEWQSNPWAI